MFRCLTLCCLCTTALFSTFNKLAAAKPKMPIPAAILPFEARGDIDEEAAQVADLLFAKLLISDNIMLVEREAIGSVLDELKLSQAGVIRADEATQVGKLTGAKLLITGSVLDVGGNLYLVAKVIGTETSRVTGASVKGDANGDLGELVDQLATGVDNAIAKKSSTLLPKVIPVKDWLATAKKQLKGKELPSITVALKEQHVGQQIFDPASRTEMERLLTDLGFRLIASDSPLASRADVVIKGEAISQRATNHADLVSVKCRVEVQVKRQSDDSIVTSDSETTIAIGLAEQIAGKSGLEEASRKIVERIVTKLAK